MGNWPIICCDDLGLPISVCIRKPSGTTPSAFANSKNYLEQKHNIREQVAAVEWPKQAGISETLSISGQRYRFRGSRRRDTLPYPVYVTNSKH